MRFSVYCLAFYFELNNHKTDTQNKISIEETVITWFTFQPGLELTGFRTTHRCFQQFYLTSPRSNRKPAIGQWSTSIKHVTSTSYKLEPAIWSRGTSRRITWGAFVWDQSGIRIIGIMQVSVCLGAILIPEYLDSILAILLPGAE